MDIKALQQLVSKGESEILEFKKSIGLLKAVFKTLVAFLNHKSGTVLIGVLDNGRIIGQEVTETTQQKIAKELPKIEPSSQVDIEYIPVNENKKVIALTVKSEKNAPYVYDGRVYQRIMDDTNRMTQHRSDGWNYRKTDTRQHC